MFYNIFITGELKLGEKTKLKKLFASSKLFGLCEKEREMILSCQGFEQVTNTVESPEKTDVSNVLVLREDRKSIPETKIQEIAKCDNFWENFYSLIVVDTDDELAQANPVTTIKIKYTKI